MWRQAQGMATLSGTTTTMITTTNDGASGLYALGGGVINVNGATEIWTGSTALSTGAGAIGIYASGTAPSSGPASQVYLNAATTVTTYGTGAFGPNSVYPYGLYASNGGLIDGSLAPSVTVTTNGTDAIGVYASGAAPPSEPGGPPGAASTITIGGVASIKTNGATAAGVQADGGGVVNLNGGSAETPNTITTITDGSIGVYAASAGIVNINGTTTISTGTTGETPTGANAYGVEANGLGSQVNLNGATTVTTLGTGAYGLYATSGGTIGATTTRRQRRRHHLRNWRDRGLRLGRGFGNEHAVDDHHRGRRLNYHQRGHCGGRAGGRRRRSDAGRRFGDDERRRSPGVVATGAGSMVTLNGTSLLTVTTITDGSIGLQAASGGVIDATGPLTISTGSTGETPSGANAYGVNADGLDSMVTLSGAMTVTTNATGATGMDAYGLYANNGGMINRIGSAERHRHHQRNGANGVYATGTAPSSTSTTPSTITIGVVALITTHGASAAGVQADLGGQVTLSGGSTATPNTVATTGNGSIALYALSGGTIDSADRPRSRHRGRLQRRQVSSPMASTPTGWARQLLSASRRQ